MPAITVASLQKLNTQGALKITNKVALFGDASAPIVSNPFDSTGALQALPSGYFSSGIVTTDGFTIARATSVSTVQSDQLVQPDRADVDSDVYTIQMKFQDTANMVVQAIDNSLQLSAITSLAPSFSATHRASGTEPQRRLVLVGEDTTRNVVIVRHFPNVTRNTSANQVWQRKTEIQYDHTFGAYPDTGLLDSDGNPTDCQTWIGGSGWAALVGADPADGALAPAWQATTAYTVGAEVKLSGGAVLQATVAGTSGSTEPVAPAVGGTVVDGTVTWKRLS